MSEQVCLCHAAHDREFTEALGEALGRVGLHAWLLQRDVPAGMAPAQALAEAMAASVAVILVLSRASAGSRPLSGAARAARTLGKPLIVVPVGRVVIPGRLADAFVAGRAGMSVDDRAAIIASHLAGDDDPTLSQTSGIKIDDLPGRVEVVGDGGGGPPPDPSTEHSSTPTATGQRVQVTIMDTTGNREQEATLPVDAAVSRIIAKLVQMMGLPINGPDGQPMIYKFHHKRSGRQLKDEQTLAEAGVAAGDVLRLLPEITAGGGPPPLLQRGELYLSAYHPREVVAEEVHQLVAYAHLARAEGEVAAHALQTLHLPPEELRGVSATSTVPVPWQSELIVLPEVKGLQFSPGQQVLSVWEDWQAAVFRFRAAADRVGTGCNGRVGFYVGGVLVADVRVCIFVRDPQSEAVLPETPACAQATPYRRIFPSHSHQDLEVVTACERYAVMCGDQYLRDIRSLRSGEEWSPRLLELIDEAEVFQLFWSANAAGSRYVEEEWRHALGRQLPHFIRPIYWQQPLPPPPVELGHIHFAYVQLRGDGR